jgi:LysM repeat protein
MIKLKDLKHKIRSSIIKKADKFLSDEIKEEIGWNKPSLDSFRGRAANLDTELNTFWGEPVPAHSFSSKDYKLIQSWTIGIIIALSLLLLLLFFSMILPAKKKISKKTIENAVVVRGNRIEPKVTQDQDKVLREELQVHNLEGEESSEVEDTTVNSPLLQSDSATHYIVQAGDSLEKISRKLYHSSSMDKIQKIRVANNITDTRSLRIGQKLIIPL